MAWWDEMLEGGRRIGGAAPSGKGSGGVYGGLKHMGYHTIKGSDFLGLDDPAGLNQVFFPEYGKTDEEIAGPAAPGPAAEDPALAAKKKEQEEITKLLRAYYDELMGELDVNDPEVKRMLSIVGGQTSQMAKDRGIEGGLSTLNTQSAMGEGLAGIRGSRRAQAAGILDQINRRDLNLMDFNEDKDRFIGGMRAADARERQEYINDQRAGPYKLLGTAVGGYFGGAAGAQAGSGAGEYMGRRQTGGAPTGRSQYYNYGSGGMRGSGRGGF